MKKLFVLVVMLVAASHIMAQSTFTIGPRVGLNYTKISSDNQSNVNYEYIRTWSGGAFVRANLGKFYVQPEAYFNTKGSNLQIRQDPSNPASQNVNGRIRLSSLDTPLLIGYKLAEGKRKKSNFRIYGGPVASFVLKEKENDLKLLNENSYEFNKSNIGIQTGVGFDLGNLTFDARYETGLNLINSYFNQRAKVFQLSVGFKLF
ncbi:porin family protein [Rhodocytophaga aerolata]|uniref:Porin family protein n=1 Tax=Rhodocytophaga aerolata TaxID=455078 RepID=A0ABT8R631_9BACT|nr:porin family protein [Rhodocytophaga aerolata]MDO1447394.1 porin family protein [Rhodocytophaga aerolata]